MDNSAQSAGRQYLFVFGAGCIATGAAFYLVSMAGILTGSKDGARDNTADLGSVKTATFHDTVLRAPQLPKPIPQPTFRFDDADTIQTALLHDPVQDQNHPDQLQQAFTPQTFVDLIGPKDATPLEKQAMLDDIKNAERFLPPLETQTSFPQPSFGIEEVKQPLQQDQTKTVEVVAGDSFSKILNDNGVARAELGVLEEHELIQRHLTRLKVGQKMEVTQDWQGDFKSLSIKVSRDTRVKLAKTADGYAVETVHLPLEYERVVTSGTIEQSLYAAAEKAQLKQNTIMNLADIFQWELDFGSDIRKGDHFSIVYDRLYRDGRYVGDGDILAAEFVRGSRVHRAIRFTDENGKTRYYAPDGKAKGRTFNRHPVDVVRITSRFDPERMHPVLHQIRAHRGVDYGSPYGSPIRAVADGHISFAGNRNAYGKTVIIKHDSKRTTLYAHMSKIDGDTKTGREVKRGDVIGYVGNTGRVTGTHLHYELRIRGVHVDPLKTELPSPEPLAASQLPALKSISNELLAQMRSVNESLDATVARHTAE